MTIDQIEAVLGFILPASARKYRPWWANALTNTQAKSWLHAGWEVDSVKLGEKLHSEKQVMRCSTVENRNRRILDALMAETCKELSACSVELEAIGEVVGNS